MKACFYKPFLRENEEILAVCREHMIRRLKVHFGFFMGIGLTIAILNLVFVNFGRPKLHSEIIIGVLFLIIIGFYFLIWHALLVRRGLVVTSQRIIGFHNTLFKRKITVVLHDQISEFDIDETFLGDILGYGGVTLHLSNTGNKANFSGYKDIKNIKKILNLKLS